MHLTCRCVTAWNVFLAQWPINCCWNRNVWIHAPAEEVPKVWLPGSCWEEKMGKIKLQTCPVSFSSKPLLRVSIRNRSLSCIWLYGSFCRSKINVGQVFGIHWEIKRELETRLVWTVTKSTIKPEMFYVKYADGLYHSWIKMNQIPCLLLQNGPDWSFPLLVPGLSCSLRSSFYYCFVFAPWSVIQNWCPDWLSAGWSGKMNIKVSVENTPALEQGWFPFSLNWNIQFVC